ncbi:hypothetical protein [Amphritea sp. HPY]|uniref:hypothetical protein n=1 Tax=Amphritea sp. HPY TaxID=3421652 RepID=UPI003D7EB97D
MLDLGSKKGKTLLALAAVSIALPAFATEESEGFDAEEFFKKGMEERTEGKPYSAIESFQTILSNEPALNRARLELAVAYLQTLQFEEAQAAAQKVLDDPSTPDNVKISILAFLAQVKKDSESLLPGHTAKVTVSAGLMYDTNVNVGPADDILNIDGNTLQLDPGAMPVEDAAYTLSAAFDHSYRTGKTLRVGENTGLVLWQSGASIYDRNYNTHDDFNLRVLSLRTGPAVITNGGFRASVPLVLDNIRLGDDELANYLGAQPTATWSLNDSTELTASVEVTKRDFTQADDQLRDSEYYSAGVSLGKGYKNNTVAVQGGFKLLTNEADLDRYSYDGGELFIGANWQFKPQATTFARYSESHSDYKGNEPVFDEARNDEERQLQIGLIYEFENALTVSGTISRIENDSNVETFEYDRDQYSLSVSKSY